MNPARIEVLPGPGPYRDLKVGCLDGERCEELPGTVDRLERVRAVYQTLPGWEQPTGGARRLADLPRAARAYLDRLQELADVPIRYVSVGTRRDQIIPVNS